MKLTLKGRRLVIVITGILVVVAGAFSYLLGKGALLLMFFVAMGWSSWSIKYENPNND